MLRVVYMYNYKNWHSIYVTKEKILGYIPSRLFNWSQPAPAISYNKSHEKRYQALPPLFDFSGGEPADKPTPPQPPVPSTPPSTQPPVPSTPRPLNPPVPSTPRPLNPPSPQPPRPLNPLSPQVPWQRCSASPPTLAEARWEARSSCCPPCGSWRWPSRRWCPPPACRGRPRGRLGRGRPRLRGARGLREKWGQ